MAPFPSSFGNAVQEPAVWSSADALPRAKSVRPPTTEGLLGLLTGAGHLDHHGLLAVMADQSRSQARIGDILLVRGLVQEADLYRALAQLWGLAVLDPAATPPDLRLLDLLGARDCLTLGLLPYLHMGGVTLILTAYPEEMARHKDRLQRIYGEVNFALTPMPRLPIA